MARAALRRFRWARHPAYVEVVGGRLEVHAPGLLRGPAPWSLPAAMVAVVDPATAEPRSAGGIDPVAFVDPVTVRYLPTTSAWAGPNLQLLLAIPLTPPRGRLPVRPRVIDGIALRAVDPRAAVAALAGAGLERTANPTAWLTGHRETTTALHARASAATRQLSDRRVRVVALALLPALAVTAWWADQAGSVLAVLALAAACCAAAALPWVLRRRDRA